MSHQFEVGDAVKHGVEGAIILANLRFWIEKNKANNRHFYNGRYWTYNSVKAWGELFPYWSANQIRRYLEKLEESGAIITGEFNESTYDRTRWFSINCQLDLAKMPTQFGELANSTTDILNTDIENAIKKDKSFFVPYEKITKAYDEGCPMLPAIAKLTDKRKKLIKSCWLFFLDDKNKNPNTGKPWATDGESALAIFIKFFEAVGRSDWLSGRATAADGKAFTGCGIEWLMTEKNFLKVLEGNYKNKGPQS